MQYEDVRDVYVRRGRIVTDDEIRFSFNDRKCLQRLYSSPEHDKYIHDK